MATPPHGTASAKAAGRDWVVGTSSDRCQPLVSELSNLPSQIAFRVQLVGVCGKNSKFHDGTKGKRKYIALT